MLSVNLLRRDAAKEDRMMRKNRNLVQAQVTLAADDYTALLQGADPTPLIAEVTTAMNRTAAERRRRVFGVPRQTDATEMDGRVAVTFESYTEPA